MRRLVVVQHNVQGIGGRCQKDDFEQGVPSAVGKRPEEIYSMVNNAFLPKQSGWMLTEIASDIDKEV
jgi:hypothetical protein